MRLPAHRRTRRATDTRVTHAKSARSRHASAAPPARSARLGHAGLPLVGGTSSPPAPPSLQPSRLSTHAPEAPSTAPRAAAAATAATRRRRDCGGGATAAQGRRRGWRHPTQRTAPLSVRGSGRHRAARIKARRMTSTWMVDCVAYAPDGPKTSSAHDQSTDACFQQCTRARDAGPASQLLPSGLLRIT